MDFSGKLFLAAIEEDNTQRALFRVRPLLCEEGNITQEDIEELIDEGFLRVVPDKAEQHTFKERMRDLGQLCLINLKDIPPDFNKVRLNKNYAPNRGETNRFVIYSDAIEDMSDVEIFEVVSDPKVVKPSTDAYYLRNGGHIQGPYDSAAGHALDAVSLIAPDNHRLFSVTMPDDREKLYFWPLSHSSIPIEKDEAIAKETPADDSDMKEKEKNTEVPEVKEAESSMSAKEKIEEIQASLVPYLNTEQEEEELPLEEEAPSKRTEKLIATPIKHNLQRMSAPRSDYQGLHSVVDRAVRQGRPEEPAASLQNTAALQFVINPAEQFKQALEQIWHNSQSKQQAVNDFLAMPGCTEALGDKICGNGKHSMQAAMQQQLNQLEAERLALMMEVEHIKENRADLMKAAMKDGSKLSEEMISRQKELESTIQTLSSQCDELSVKREELRRNVNSVLQSGSFIAPSFGVDCSFEKACKLITESLNKSGFVMSKNDAANLLIIILLSPQLNLRTDYLMDAKLATSLTANAIGAVLISDDELKSSVILPGGDTPVFVTAASEFEGSAANSDLSGYTTLLLTDSKTALWPSVFMPISDGFVLRQSAPSGIKIKVPKLREYLEEVSRQTPDEVLKLLGKAEQELKQVLPLKLKQAMIQYLMCAQSILEGGAAAAVDYAFASFLIPFAIENRLDIEPLRSICEAMPKASAML